MSNDEELTYEEPLPLGRMDLQNALDENRFKDAVDALLGLTYHDSDWHWLQTKCLSLLDHHDSGVRGMAALCLGHVATFHHDLNLEVVVPRLREFENDPYAGFRASDALDDIDAAFRIRSRGGWLRRIVDRAFGRPRYR